MLTEKNSKKRGRGRPAIGKGPLIGVRLRPELDEALERWVAQQGDPKLTKQEAIRRILWKALIQEERER